MNNIRPRSILPAVLFLVAIALLLFWQIVRLAVTEAWIDHTDQVIGKAYFLENQIAKSESGVRGYVITEDSNFLEQYERAISNLPGNLEKLKQLTQDNPSQTQRINLLQNDIHQWLTLSRTIVNQKQNRKKVAPLIRGNGKTILDTIHTRFEEIVAVENQLRQDRVSITNRAIGYTSTIFIIAFILICIFVIRTIFLQRNWQNRLEESEIRYRGIIENVKDYAIFMLDPRGIIMTSSKGVEPIEGFETKDIIGQHFSIFYPQKDIESGKAQRILRIASTEGRYEDEGWRIRKDGSSFWANVVFTAIRDSNGRLMGFSKIVRNLTERKRFEAELQEKNAALIAANKELESFSYSVSHDLRAPLRSTDGFSKALLEEYGNQLDDQAKDYLRRIRAASQKMAKLIDSLLNLSRLSRKEMVLKEVNLSHLVQTAAEELHKNEPQRKVKFKIAPGIIVNGDRDLLSVAINNLLDNAWKFTSKHSSATIEFGVTELGQNQVYFVRDDGAGFDMAYMQKLFGPFQRLHRTTEFPGIGVGLATVYRIVRQHGGRVWAESEIEKGTTFFFTLETGSPRSNKILKESAA